MCLPDFYFALNQTNYVTTEILDSRQIHELYELVREFALSTVRDIFSRKN